MFQAFALSAVLAMASPASPPPEQAPAVTVSHAWVREAPPGVTVMGGYITIENTGAAPILLRRISSPVFGRIEMHMIAHVDGIQQMVPMIATNLEPGATLRFEPGGMHLMLFDPVRRLKPGEHFPLTLDFGPAGRKTLEAEVRRGAAAPHHH